MQLLPAINRRVLAGPRHSTQSATEAHDRGFEFVVLDQISIWQFWHVFVHFPFKQERAFRVAAHECVWRWRIVCGGCSVTPKRTIRLLLIQLSLGQGNWLHAIPESIPSPEYNRTCRMSVLSDPTPSTEPRIVRGLTS